MDTHLDVEEVGKKMMDGTLEDADLTNETMKSLLIWRFGSLQKAEDRLGKTIRDIKTEEKTEKMYAPRGQDDVMYTPIIQGDDNMEINLKHLNGVRRIGKGPRTWGIETQGDQVLLSGLEETPQEAADLEEILQKGGWAVKKVDVKTNADGKVWGAYIEFQEGRKATMAISALCNTKNITMPKIWCALPGGTRAKRYPTVTPVSPISRTAREDMRSLYNYMVIGVDGYSEAEIRMILRDYTMEQVRGREEEQEDETFESEDIKKSTLDAATGEREDWGQDRCYVTLTGQEDEKNALLHFQANKVVAPNGKALQMVTAESGKPNSIGDYRFREVEASTACLKTVEDEDLDTVVDELAERLAEVAGCELLEYNSPREPNANSYIFPCKTVQMYTFPSGDKILKARLTSEEAYTYGSIQDAEAWRKHLSKKAMGMRERAPFATRTLCAKTMDAHAVFRPSARGAEHHFTQSKESKAGGDTAQTATQVAEQLKKHQKATINAFKNVIKQSQAAAPGATPTMSQADSDLLRQVYERMGEIQATQTDHRRETGQAHQEASQQGAAILDKVTEVHGQVQENYTLMEGLGRTQRSIDTLVAMMVEERQAPAWRAGSARGPLPAHWEIENTKKQMDNNTEKEQLRETPKRTSLTRI
eukprot:1292094-Pyramimonas_sp.AAC.1